MARARRKTVKESTAVQPVVEPTPEVAAATAASAATPGQAHASRPQDQVAGTTEGMTRAEVNSAVINAVLTADDQKANQVLATIAQPAPETDAAKPEDKNDEIADDAVAVNQTSVASKPSDASPAQVEMKEAIEAMFAGEELSETFTNKAAAIFEAMVNERVAAFEQALTEELSEDFELQMQVERETLEEAIDAYLTNAASNYLTENALAVESGIKSDLYESMITDIGNVIKSYNIALDDDQIELVTEAYAEVDDLKAKANELVETTQAQTQYIAELQKQLVFESISSDLTAIQRGSLATLAESVEPDSVDVMTDKLSALKEHLLRKQENVIAAAQSAQAFTLTEEIAEEPQSPKYVHGNMKHYVNAVSTQVKK